VAGVEALEQLKGGWDDATLIERVEAAV